MSDVDKAIAAIEHPGKRADAARLVEIFKKASGYAPYLANARLIGFGRYAYTYETGRSGTWLATGIGISKARFALHIMPGYKDFPEIMARLGKHKTGAACVYINTLADMDEAAVADLVRAGLDHLATLWPIAPT
ncbi:MAG: DUF1801 domain-containing protein [Pseudomonadota bacterium]